MLDILKFLKKIKSFEQLAMLFIGSIAILVSYLLYENRVVIVDRLTRNSSIEINIAKDDSSKLFGYVLQSSYVNSVLLYSVDLGVNKKVLIAWKSKEPIISAEIEQNKNIHPIENLFSEKNPEENLIAAQLINNKVACVPYSKYRNDFSDQVDKKIKAVCSISVPPSFGKTNGILTTFLTKEPSQEDAQNLALILNEVSSSIIRKDILLKLKDH